MDDEGFVSIRDDNFEEEMEEKKMEEEEDEDMSMIPTTSISSKACKKNQKLPVQLGMNPTNLTRQSVWLFGNSTKKSGRRSSLLDEMEQEKVIIEEKDLSEVEEKRQQQLDFSETDRDLLRRVLNRDEKKQVQEDDGDEDSKMEEEELDMKMMIVSTPQQQDIAATLPDPVTILAPPDYLQGEDRPQTWPLPHVCETDRLSRWKDRVPKERNAFYMSRSFGASFGMISQGSFVLIHSGRSRSAHESTEDLDDDHVMLENLPSSVVTLETVYPSIRNRLTSLNLNLMRLARDSSDVVPDERGVPIVRPRGGFHIISLLHKYLDTMKASSSSDYEDFSKSMISVWELLNALWGIPSLNDKCAETNTLPTPLALIGSDVKLNEMGRDEYIQRMIRREALSEWLRRTVNSEEQEKKEEEEEEEKRKKEDDNVLKHLLCGRIGDAFRTALASGHLRLATLVTQAGGDERVRDLLRKQIEIWKSQRCDTFINEDILKSYGLLAGERDDDLPSTWKQALLLEFLYYHPPNNTIADIVAEYSRQINNDDIDLPRPVPRYAERSPNTYRDFKTTFCSTEWHLLRFYCEQGRIKSLIQSLQNRSHTPIFLQHVLSWHLLRTFSLSPLS